MTDDTNAEIARQYFDRSIAAEHEEYDQPAEIALLHRTFPTYTETMWIGGYPGVRMITVTCPEVVVPAAESSDGQGFVFPGVVKELPVGWRDMASAEAFHVRFLVVVTMYEAEGWVRQTIADGATA